ncbi:retrovirus-related pol polyprotein from transposon TNT 1-94 [Tanacetum coccineum]
MANLLEGIQCAGSDTRPPMLDRTDFASWQQRIRLYCREGNEGTLHLGPERPRVYSDLSPEDKDRYNADIRATNILLQGLPKDIYSLINHYTDAKDIWDNVKMLLEGSKLTKEDRESQLYDDFEHFRQHKGETIHDYYVRFTKLINDMRNIKMTMSRMQLNYKFINNMLLEWGIFVTALKLNRGLRDSDYDQLYAYLKQHEAHANENKMMLERFTQHTVDPLALMFNVAPQQYNSQSSTNPSFTYVPPHFADNSQLDSGLSPTDNLIENLTNTLALLTQSYKTYLPQTNNQLRFSSNPRNQATVQDDRVVNRVGNANPGQAMQVKCYNCNGIGHIARNYTQPKRPQNSEYFKDKMLLMQAQENGVALDEEQLLFLAADDCDAFDSDVDEAPTTETMFMANLSSTDPVYDKAGLSYDSDILSEVHDHDQYQDAVCEHHEEHEMHADVQPNYVVDSHANYTSDSNMIPYDQYVKDNAVPVVQSNVSSVPNDAYMMIYNDMYEPHAQSVFKTTQNTVVDNSLTAELATYKEQVELYERRARFELTEREQKIDEQLRIVITDRNIKEENLKKELHSVKLQLASTINHNKSMVEEVTSLKKDFKQKENKYLEEFLDMKALKEKVEDKLYKQDQSLQTVHMLCKPKPYYDELNKVAIGYKNLLCLTRVKQAQPALYNGHEIIKINHVPTIVYNSEDTLEIAKITRKKINDKMKDPEYVQKKVKITPPDYSKENYLETFTPHKQLTPEQIFWSQDLIKMKAEALKKQATASRPIKALTVYPSNTPAMLVPRVLLTKKHFEGIQKALTKEIKEIKDIFEELEAEVDQNGVNRKHDEIERKNLLIANDNLIADCLSKEVFYVATNSELNISSFTEMHDAHTSLKARCLELEVELSNLRDQIQKDNHDELIKQFSNLEASKLDSRLAISGFWINKPDFDTMGLDDLYNNFKIVKQKVKRSDDANNDDKNLAFLTTSVNAASTETSTASLSDATVYAFLSTQPQGSQQVHEDLEQIHDDDLEEMDLKWNMALLSMRARKFYQRTGRKIIIDGSSTAGYDKSKVECFNCHKMGHFARECRAPRSKDNRNWNQGSSSKAVRIEDASEKAMCAIDGAGFDWSDMAEEEIQANMALMAFSDSEVTNDKSCSKSCLKNYEALKKQYDDLLVKLDDTGFKASTYKRGLSILEGQILKYKESEVLFSEEIALLKRSVGHKEYQMGLLRDELEKVKQEKEGFEFKIAKFDKSAKDLEQLLASQITDKSKKGFGYNAVPSPHPLILNRPTPLDLSYSGLEEFKEPEVNEYGPRDSSLKPTIGCDKESNNSKENTDDSLEQHQKTDTETSSVKEVEPKKVRENNDAPIIKDWVSDDEDDDEPNPKVEKKTVIPTATKKEFVKPEKPVRRSVRYAEMYRSQRPRGNQRNWNGQKSNQLGCNFVFNNKACFICGSFDHIQYSCPNQQRKRIVSGNNYNKKDNDYYSKTSHPSAHKHMAPRAVLMKTGLKSINTARPVNTVRSVNTGRPFSTARSFNTVRPSYTAHPKSTIHCARPRTYFQNQAQSTIHRPFYKRTALTKRCFNQRFNTGRPFRSTNTVREKGFNVVKPSACWVWKPIKPNGASLSNSQLNDKGFVDSGCSRHMTGNIAHLSDFKDFDGGYVTFGGGAHGGRITGTGTIKTGNLDFDDVYFVKELKFNLFSVSQMCDKKNYVLFTDSECLVLSPNFKLPDANQILLKIPRQDNMYSFDMKNIVPKDSLTCLVAKATSEESMLWHRRLGHINFKNINKLVKENLVRDLPLKRFENDQTCVACLKGKQHRASCKTKAFNPITKPLFMLHMDLFGPTFVSSLMHKKYCLVVTDDYSRFSWVFFLTTKDETSEILKNFIKEVENLVDKKVKIIRSDNGTEFKNKVMDDFCREKGIKREYSVARTPQQNGVAERKNRTLIEAARTMLADSKLPTTFWAEAVSTACYVQNRVLIVKPHNKTPYELFRGFKPAIGFMKPFGCHVTILNTLDNLGKFDEKSDEGFFVGYSLSSKAFRVYNIRTRKVQENLHIGFLENKPMIEGNGPKWLFDLDSLTQSMNYVPVVAGKSSNDFAGIQGVSESSTSSQQDQDWIVMPIWKDASYFGDASPKIVDDAQIEDKDELHDEDDATEESHDGSSLKENGTADQQVNTARPDINTGSREVSTALPEVNTATPEDLVGPSPASEDSHVEDQEIELGNIPQSYEVPTTPHTRIHKDHPIEHVIGDVQSSVQTRRMKTSYSEKGFLSAIYEGKTHQDLHTCLFVCFLSQEEPKRVSQALRDPAWVEAMQEELLQFKLQKVWILVDLPKGHRAIGQVVSAQSVGSSNTDVIRFTMLACSH